MEAYIFLQLFELVVGQPPFDSFMITPTILVRQMLEMANDELPERWQRTWRAMDSASPGEKSGYTLQEWLEEIYFDEEKNQDLTREDILKVGQIVRSMLQFEPSKRASAGEVLRDSWFEGELSNNKMGYRTSALTTRHDVGSRKDSTDLG